MASDRATFVQPSLSLNISKVSFLRVFEVPNDDFFAVNMDQGSPYRSVFDDTHVPMLVVFPRPADVLDVLRVRDVAQVADPVVSGVAVDMVNLVNRPLAVDVQPSETMGSVFVPVHPNVDVSGRLGFVVDRAELDANRGSNLSAKNSSLGVVIKKFAQAIYAKIRFSHDALQKRIGQRPDGASTLFGLRHFNTIGAL
jgi:hypothetical protein